ncbi:hypothetical protein [Hymenobacter saemangeumensis]
MKTTLTILGLLLGALPLTAQAQMADRQNPVPAFVRPPGAAAATELTREMAARLQLNEYQYLQLLPLNQTRLTQLNLLNRQYQNDQLTRLAKIAELEAYYEQECRRILTPTQLSQLQQTQQPASLPDNESNGLG